MNKITVIPATFWDFCVMMVMKRNAWLLFPVSVLLFSGKAPSVKDILADPNVVWAGELRYYIEFSQSYPAFNNASVHNPVCKNLKSNPSTVTGHLFDLANKGDLPVYWSNVYSENQPMKMTKEEFMQALKGTDTILTYIAETGKMDTVFRKNNLKREDFKQIQLTKEWFFDWETNKMTTRCPDFLLANETIDSITGEKRYWQQFKFFQENRESGKTKDKSELAFKSSVVWAQRFTNFNITLNENLSFYLEKNYRMSQYDILIKREEIKSMFNFQLHDLLNDAVMEGRMTAYSDEGLSKVISSTEIRNKLKGMGKSMSTDNQSSIFSIPGICPSIFIKELVYFDKKRNKLFCTIEAAGICCYELNQNGLYYDQNKVQLLYWLNLKP